MITTLRTATSDAIHISERMDGIILTWPESMEPHRWQQSRLPADPNFYLMAFKYHPDNVLIIGLGGLLRDQRVARSSTMTADDGYGHAGTFDAVMVDSLRSESAHSNNIHWREFFSLVRSRMKPDRVMVIWSDEWVTLPSTDRVGCSSRLPLLLIPGDEKQLKSDPEDQRVLQR
jgi:hypothetical protein